MFINDILYNIYTWVILLKFTFITFIS